MIVLRRMLAVFLLTIAMPHMTMAEERIDESTELVNRLVTHIQGLVNSNPDAMTIRAETDAVIHQYFDYDLIARFAAGNAWRSASDDQRSRYKTVFREVMLSLAETQFDYFKTLEYKAKAVIPTGRKLVIVSGTIHDRSGQFPDATVNWRVSTKPGKPARIIDIEIENISMLITQQQEHTAIINQNGGSFEALIDALTEQANDIRSGKFN